VKTIISRAGEGTKMVLTGDPYQIDNPYLDAASNGLTYTAERLKEQPIHGHVTLYRSERSQLAAAAADLL
jgi:PhoH-like ATPase